MNPVFSIVLVSRNRPHLLSSLLRTIEKTAILDYEVFVGLDDDDDTNDQLIVNNKNAKIHFLKNPRTANLHHYINKLAISSNGDYVFGLNDDCEIINKGWDRDSKKVLDKMGGCCYGVTKDNSIDKVGPADYASFPVISRSAIDKLGFFMEDTCGNHGADVITHRIYKDSNLICHLPIYIRHIFHESDSSLQSRLKDKTAKEMIDRTLGENVINRLFTFDVSKYVEKLK